MTTSHLYCIFNANDPTPTAFAIRSLNFQTATVFVVNQKAFTDKQNSNLDRLKKWINGSAKPEGWPEGWWNPDWDWAEATPEVSMEYVDELTPEIFGNTDADHTFVDLKGGTKAMSIDLMDYANERLDNPQFIFSNPGESLLLSKGVVLPRDVLGLNEIVFLASGYVMNEEYVPEPRIAEKIKLEFKYITETKMKKKRARFDSKFLESIKRYVPPNLSARAFMEQAFLEEFTSAMLSVSEEVTQSVAGVRFIDPSFEISRESAEFMLNLPYIKKRMEKKPKKKKIYDTSLELLKDFAPALHNHGHEASLELIRQHMHIMEIDALAILSSGELIGVECKYGSYQPDDVHRIRAICQRLSPRSTPVLVNSKLYSTNVYNVAELSFTELDNAIEMIRQLDSQTPQRPTPQIDDSKNKQGRGRNALHCLPLIEIALVSASSIGGTFAMFKRAMSQLQISMEHMDEALTLLGEKLGFKINDMQDNHWIEWNSAVESELDLVSEKDYDQEDSSSLTRMEGHINRSMNETIESLLELYKISPRSFAEFCEELKKAGFSLRRLRERLVRTFSKKYNFEIVEASALFSSGSKWIIWK